MASIYSFMLMDLYSLFTLWTYTFPGQPGEAVGLINRKWTLSRVTVDDGDTCVILMLLWILYQNQSTSFKEEMGFRIVVQFYIEIK